MTNEELVAEIQSGNSEAMEQLWNQCYKYIRKTANRWAAATQTRPGFDIEDLMQSAFLALYDAVNGFRADKGKSFIGYLDMCLKGEFTKVCGNRTVRDRKDPLNNCLSLDYPIESDDGDSKTQTMVDFIKDPVRAEDAIEDAIFMQQCAEVIKTELQKLPENQEQAIASYYLNGKNYSEIAEDMQCTGSYVGALVKKGLRTLKRSVTLKRIFDDMNYYSDRNLYRNTGYTSWKRTGSSVQEYEVIRKEEQENARYKAELKLEEKIQRAMELTGWDYDFIKWIYAA